MSEYDDENVVEEIENDINQLLLKIKGFMAPHENILSDDEQYEDFEFTMLMTAHDKLKDVIYYVKNY